ncbi:MULTISPECIES: hypothetical protein [unclassified Streptomyces]|uniref:hypothetical protein n=1 Tax=unclassified Streptomyces TaxID=2593676 RepID=UPI0023659FBA|nr:MULTISPECIES: hypothetical protein [unclassified Streptomyces]MDF3147011.1 hypothetical protein [Streptomyces sp. T21Q-yed]WDF35606.1 hypothetical protein PBV52_01690 [Streptomyces sp. T12]
MRRGLAVVAVLAATAVAGCGAEEDPVVAGTAPAAPYDGPLYVPAQDLDEDSARAVRAGSGAAGRALECDGEIYSGGGSEPWSEGDGGSTAEDGLEAYFEIEQPDVPRSGYRVEREGKGRVLFSYDVDGRTKVAVIVAKDRKDRPGWGPETSASCDPAELPESFTATKEYEIWTDEDGHRVPTTEISSSAGSAHCDWQQAHFLELGAHQDRKLYARDPDGVLEPGMLNAAYDGDVPMPDDAHDTGYRLGDRRLWLTDDTSTAYVRTPDGVEAWPRVKDGMGCK